MTLIDYAQLCLNDHSWYRIDSISDLVRSILWILINLATGISYFLIPIEIYHWSKAISFPVINLITTAFIGFIVFCGLHHFVDIAIMPTAPWWAILSVNIPMGIFSIATAIVLRRLRKSIVSVLSAMGKWYSK